jgi:hypothetical protein
MALALRLEPFEHVAIDAIHSGPRLYRLNATISVVLRFGTSLLLLHRIGFSLGEVTMDAPRSWEGKPSWVTGDIFVRPIKHALLRAWEPWDFARSLLFEFQHTDFDDEHPEWRLYWFSGIVTLRAIGHVLHKVDAETSHQHRSSIAQFWTKLKSDIDRNWIFFDFIEKERNNILKEFSFGAKLPSSEDGRLLAYDGTHLDGVELYREAVYWWRAQLDYLEAQLSAA